MGKTRCSKCINFNKKVTENPCCKCGEIHYKMNGFENHFLDASKNLMIEERK
jgi:hypothetical protein